MPLTVMNDLEQRSPEWLAARCGIVTASVVGKLLTPTLKVADNDTSRGVTAALVAERITGICEETRMTDDMWRGVEHEPHARAAYTQHHVAGLSGLVSECGFMRLDGDGWTLGYSPDGLVGDDGLIEIKCPRAKGHINTILADEVPAYYMAQCQAALLVSGRKWLDYVSFHAGLPLYVKRVKPDDLWHEAIADAVQQFEDNVWQMVESYDAATKNLPATERIDLEVVI